MAKFDEVKATFWTEGTYGVQPPLTHELVRESERVLGLTLPSSLLELLLVQNGGQVATDWNAFPTSRPTSWSQDHVPFNALMGIGHQRALSLPEMGTPGSGSTIGYAVGRVSLRSPGLRRNSTPSRPLPQTFGHSSKVSPPRLPSTTTSVTKSCNGGQLAGSRCHGLRGDQQGRYLVAHALTHAARSNINPL